MSISGVQLQAASGALRQRFREVRAHSLALAAPLSAEDQCIQSMPDASPTKWHLAHTTWFFETVLLMPHLPGYEPFDRRFQYLFNSYYEALGPRHPRPQRGLLTRPSLQQVHDYRAHVDAAVQRLLQQPGSEAQWRQVEPIVTLGLNHEQQHQELLLTDIKHALSFNPARPAYASRWPLAGIHPQPVEWLRHEAGLVEHGYDAARDGEFAFDNETPRHKAYVAAFELASRPVTNGEIMAFIADRGYQRPELWLSMGWDWVTENKVSLPFYWQGDDGGYQHFTLQGLIDVDPNTPACHLSYFEADAFARWACARLPTEFEWELAARGLPAAAAAQGNFVETSAFHPLPQQEGSRGLPAQMFGDVWEWTQSNYNPYPGYKPWEGLVGEYNGKFMCNQFVLRGGSCATPQSHMRASYRNFFPPDARWQFSGLRLARDLRS